MFQRFGRVIAWSWPVWLAGWVLLLAGVSLTAPAWDAVVEDGEFAFLPDDVPSRRAEGLFARAFPEQRRGSRVVLVVRRVDGLRGEDRRLIADELAPRLRGLIGGPGSLVVRVRTAAEEAAGPLLDSDDGRASLVVVELHSEFLEYRNWPAIAAIESIIEEIHRTGRVPPGLEIGLSGDAGVGRDLTRGEAESADATEFWTVMLVITLLVLVYRAPLLALVPLVTLVFAVETALRSLSLLAGAGHIGLFQGIQVYTTVIVYGAGVDYSLFLSARYKEELDRGSDHARAIADAIGRVGPAVAASAGTEIFGIGMLVFAAFGKFHQAGISIAFGLLVLLCAAMTFTPALLRLAGRWAFWPQLPPGRRPEEYPRFSPTRLLGPLMERELFQTAWDRLGRALERRPGTIWIITVGLLAPFAVVAVLFHQHLSYGLLDELPRDAPSVVGTQMLREHFPAGTLGTVTVLLDSDDVDFGSDRGVGLVRELGERLLDRRDELRIADVRSVAHPLGTRDDAEPMAAGETLLERMLRRGVVRRRAVEHYVSGAVEPPGRMTRMELVLELDPFSRESTIHLDRLEEAIRRELPGGLRPQTRLHLLGATPSLRDLRHVADSDRVRISRLVVLAVLAVLIVLLRDVPLSLYLVLTVVFNYLATLGVTFAVFWALDPQGFNGLHWTVPLFLFTVLIAVSQDYNIFLVTRAAEEQARHGPVRGVTTALSRSGRIIAGCGVIMAGTFSSLLVGGKLARMEQLGFALAFGLLLQTFVIMPVLVPAWLILRQRLRRSKP